MEASAQYQGQVVKITTDHATSSYGLPVMLLDEELIDGRPAEQIAEVLISSSESAQVRDAARAYLNALPPLPTGSIGAFGVDFSGPRRKYQMESE